MKTVLTIAFMVLSVYACATFGQTTVAGITLDDQATVGGDRLTLNGAGIRTKAGFKVYVTGLYLSEPTKTAEEALSLAGAKRLTIVMLRNVNTNDLGTSFTTAFNGNTTAAERARMFSSIARFNAFFETESVLNNGDTITLDWVPGTGLRCSLNDESVGEAISDMAFYQAMLKVWIGTRAVDTALKAELLSGVADTGGKTVIRNKVRPVTDQ
jgi:hypothetical protein